MTLVRRLVSRLEGGSCGSQPGGMTPKYLVKLGKDKCRSFDSPLQTEKRLGPLSLRMAGHFMVWTFGDRTLATKEVAARH